MLLFCFSGTVSLDLQLQWSPFPVAFNLMSVESFKLVMSFDYKILILARKFFISTIFPDFLIILGGREGVFEIQKNINFLRNARMKFQHYFTVFLAVKLGHMIKYFSKKKLYNFIFNEKTACFYVPLSPFLGIWGR